MKNKTLLVAENGMMCAMAITLSAFESMIPPMPFLPPGAKLGLSNIATMLAAQAIGWQSAIAVAIVKSLFALVTRGFTAFLMSLSGGLLSVAVMCILINLKKKMFGYIGIGVCGAVAHNIGQLLIAAFMVGTAIYIYIPMLIIFGIVAGAITGSVMGLLLPPLEKLENHFNNSKNIGGKENGK